jgi:uncharacterized membrane protein YjjP (DUF1212 family)
MPPYFLLSLILGAMYGVMFHLWRGKTFQDLVLYFFAGIIGFLLGHGLGNLLGFDFFLIGSLHLAEATIVSWANLFVVQWLKI